MSSIRLLAIAPLFALVSCSALIANSGRDPKELIGRSRSSIHAEFGKPTKTEIWVTGEPIDYIFVKGPWKNEGLVLAVIFVDLLTLGVLEPLYTVQAATHRSKVTSEGQYLELLYMQGKVVKAWPSSLDK